MTDSLKIASQSVSGIQVGGDARRRGPPSNSFIPRRIAAGGGWWLGVERIAGRAGFQLATVSGRKRRVFLAPPIRQCGRPWCSDNGSPHAQVTVLAGRIPEQESAARTFSKGTWVHCTSPRQGSPGRAAALQGLHWYAPKCSRRASSRVDCSCDFHRKRH